MRHKLIVLADKTKIGDEDEKPRISQTRPLLTLDAHTCRRMFPLIRGVDSNGEHGCELLSIQG